MILEEILLINFLVFRSHLDGCKPVLGQTWELRRHEPGQVGDLCLTRRAAVWAVEVPEVLITRHAVPFVLTEVFRVHRDDVDLGPGLEDAQLLQGGGRLVVAARAGALLQLGEAGHQ